MKRLLEMPRERHVQLASWARVHFFRFWTATTVVVLFGLGFWYVPELLTWWQKTILLMIDHGSQLLPYPWSNRVDFVMVNFGASIWLEITFAIILFRVLLWPVILWLRRSRDSKKPSGPPSKHMENSLHDRKTV